MNLAIAKLISTMVMMADRRRIVGHHFFDGNLEKGNCGIFE